jgi:UTP-glucose-1-phosphate uridylyltransferase
VSEHKTDKADFAGHLRALRNRSLPPMPRSKLAPLIGVSVGYISFLENAEDKRLPKRHVVNAIADCFKLSAIERNRLLKAAGHSEITADADRLPGEITEIVATAELATRDTELLLREIRAHAQRWVRLRQARQRDVRKAVIVAAGWQARLLAPNQLQGMILHAAQEAMEAEISELLVVMAPLKEIPDFSLCHRAAKTRGITVTIDTVTQAEPRGLGDAILRARDWTAEEPFAVILPVDVDPSLLATAEMKSVYKKIQKPLVGITAKGSLTASELQHYGLAILGEPFDKKIPQALHVIDLHEKPQKSASKQAGIIFGRYILTPDIFDAIQVVPKNPITKKHEITDALAELVRNHHFVGAYRYGRPILPLAPVRALLELLVESISQRSRLTEMIKITRAALAQMQQLGEAKAATASE